MKTLVSTCVEKESFMALVSALQLKPPVLIKPNWGTVECYTEATILDWTLSTIPGEKLVIESHGWARNPEALEGKPGGALTKANLRRGNDWFLEYSGCAKVLQKHRVEFLNLSEEIWAGRAADPESVQRAVESKFSPLQATEMYAKVPQRLFDLRGGSLLSLAKYKVVFYPLGVSLAVKNLFGLIPGPSRGKYHGKGHALLDQSIVDINKIYSALFETSGIVEAVFSAGFLEKESDSTRVRPNCGVAFANRDIVSLDAFATAVAGRDPASVGHLRLAGEVFGAWDAQTISDAVESGITIPSPVETK
jgi:uncharacterized protein (DUF362 family)